MKDVVYSGSYREGPSWFHVFRDLHPLSPHRSQRLENHSPDGFAWGYGGSGPAQLALALLYDATDNVIISRMLYQSFKFTVVATWPMKGRWMLTRADICAWVDWTMEHDGVVPHWPGFGLYPGDEPATEESGVIHPKEGRDGK